MGHPNYRVLRSSYTDRPGGLSAAALLEKLLLDSINRNLSNEVGGATCLPPSVATNEPAPSITTSTIQGAGRDFDCGGNIPIDFRATLPPFSDLLLPDGTRIRFDFSYPSRCI